MLNFFGFWYVLFLMLNIVKVNGYDGYVLNRWVYWLLFFLFYWIIGCNVVLKLVLIFYFYEILENYKFINVVCFLLMFFLLCVCNCIKKELFCCNIFLGNGVLMSLYLFLDFILVWKLSKYVVWWNFFFCYLWFEKNVFLYDVDEIDGYCFVKYENLGKEINNY